MSIKVITGKCRLSYAHVWEPHQMDADSPAKYSACVVIPKSDKATLDKIKAAIDGAIKEGVQSKWGGKKPGNLKLPLRDGDEDHPDDETFHNCYFINANANRQPGVVDMQRNAILDKDELYSGCYCRFSISFFPFAGLQKGIAAGLNNIQKVCDGPRLDGGSSPEDDFDDDFTDSDFADLF